MTTYTYKYDPHTMWDNFTQMRWIMRVMHSDRNKRLHQTDITSADYDRLSTEMQNRYWIVREMESYPLHSVIEAAVMLSRPHDWHQLFLEWPHISQGDRTRIAYTQNEAKGQRNVQTVTSVGKYLRRHFPNLSDHAIRDLVARHGSADTYKFVHTTAEMIYHLHRGPGSCMVWGANRGVHCHDGVTRHPYEAYDPKYGWHMAVRISGDDTVGRALCMTDESGHKYFVRTYAKSPDNGYSQADNGMENWLRDQGYSKHSSWDNGAKLAYHGAGDHFLAPYLDGSDKCVAVVGDNMYIVIDDEGDYTCDQTGGVPSYADEDCFDCEDCGDSTSDDDGYWVGYHDDCHVCESCYEHNYVYGYGRNGRQYSFNSDDAVYVESQSEYYHSNYLSDNEIVELDNGEFEHIDEAVEVNGDWYHIDDDRICRTNDTDEYMMCDEGCWQCTESGDWYSDSVDFVEVDGNKYHPDNAPERDDEDSDDDICVTLPPAVAVAPVVTTPLTREMLDKVQMVWDYSLNAEQVTVSLTLTHDGRELHAHRVYNMEFVNGIDHEGFVIFVRNVLSNDILSQATETI